MSDNPTPFQQGWKVAEQWMGSYAGDPPENPFPKQTEEWCRWWDGYNSCHEDVAMAVGLMKSEGTTHA